MKSKKNKIIYLSTTILFSAIILFSILLYFFNYQDIVQCFQELGFPAYIVYPIAIAKTFGLIAIWTRKSVILKEWAYAGFFFTVVLAVSAHLVARDGQFPMAAIALVLLIVSYIYDEKAPAITK